MIAFIYFSEYLPILKYGKLNTKALISMARSMDLLQIDTSRHDESDQSLSFVRYSLDLKWMINNEIQV